MDSNSVYMAHRGELDLRGYEIVRVQFFNMVAVRSVTFSTKGIRFSSECIRNIGDDDYVNMLIHPAKKSLIVKPCTQWDKQKVRWATIKNEIGYSREISCAAYIKTLYELFDWSPEYRYRFRGCLKVMDGGKTIEFDLSEPETITSETTLYPDDWESSFGMDYYRYANSRICAGNDNSSTTQYIYNIEPNIYPTAPEILNESINSIINTMINPEEHNGAEADS